MTYRRLPATQPPERLRWLAEHIIGNRVVWADQVAGEDPHLISVVFIPIAFGALEEYRKEQLPRLAVFAIQGVHTDCLRAINGWPMFIEMCVWRRTDAAKAFDLADRARAAMVDA